MKRILSNTLIFAVGAVIGSAVTWKLIERKYNQIAEDEIAEMREYYRNKESELDEKNEQTPDPNATVKPVAPKQKSSLSEYKSILKGNGYSDKENNNDEEEEDEDMCNGPEIIPPDELGALYGYDVEYLNYYTDGVLTDDVGNVIEDAEDMVGTEFPECFGEWEDDHVCVRNDRREVDYEITKMPMSFADIVNFDPYHTEDE